jgi:hypothetical protein
MGRGCRRTWTNLPCGRGGFARVGGCHVETSGEVTESGLSAGWRWRAFVAALLLATVLSPALLQAETSDPPRFQIEKIVVDGLRHGSPGIVVSASLLKPGTAYTEVELRAAVYRVERLPFVLAADFSLRKGSVRNTFELVITVTQTSDFFLAAELATTVGHGGGQGVMVTPTLGARTFFGAYSEVSATATTFASTSGHVPHDVSTQVSYTHHNLFGLNMVGTVSVVYYSPTTGEFGTETGLNARLVAPLGGDHALRLDLARGRSEGGTCADIVIGFPCIGDTTYDRGALDWLFDNTDDPFTPRHGARMSAGGSYRASRTPQSWGRLSQQQSPPDSTWDDATLHVDATRFFPLGRAQAAGIGVSYSYSWREVRNLASALDGSFYDSSDRSSQASLKASYTANLWQPRGRESFTQIWLESSAELVHWEDSFHLEAEPQSSSTVDYMNLTTALAARGRWGTLRLTLSYGKSLRSGL